MTQSLPSVSCLVTVFNRETTLKQTVLSVLDSCFEDFEIVIVDDCSSDQSLAIAEELAASDARIRVVRNDLNLGDYGNRMKAASLARGRYLKYVDSDDLIYPHSLQLMVDAMERDPAIALALSHSLPEDEQPYPWVLTPEESFRKHFLGRGCFGCGPTGAIIRRSAFEEIGGFRKKWLLLSDLDLWLRIGARWPVALMPPGLVWWRHHPGQEFRSNDARMFYLEQGFMLSQDAINSESCPLSEIDRQTAGSRIRQHYARRLLSLAARERNLKTAWKLYCKSGLTVFDLLSGLKSYQ